MCAIWDWAEFLIFCRFWTKIFFESGSRVDKLRGGPLWPSEVRSLIFGHFQRMGISLWPVGPSKMLRCQNFYFDPIFLMPHQKFVKVHNSPLQPQKWVLDALSQKIDPSNFKYNQMHTDMMPFDKK